MWVGGILWYTGIRRGERLVEKLTPEDAEFHKGEHTE